MVMRSHPTLWCDGLNPYPAREGHARTCPVWFNAMAEDARGIRAEARRHGWVRKEGRDYSASCAKAAGLT